MLSPILSGNKFRDDLETSLGLNGSDRGDPFAPFLDAVGVVPIAGTAANVGYHAFTGFVNSMAEMIDANSVKPIEGKDFFTNQNVYGIYGTSSSQIYHDFVNSPSFGY